MTGHQRRPYAAGGEAPRRPPSRRDDDTNPPSFRMKSLNAVGPVVAVP